MVKAGGEGGARAKRGVVFQRGFQVRRQPPLRCWIPTEETLEPRTRLASST
jgi:hypothetical protein